jgi:DNA-binding XRE family transcriptional regulator
LRAARATKEDEFMALKNNSVAVARRKERERLADEFLRFRQQNLHTQRMLAEVIGISRRTVQSIEAGAVLPHVRVREAFLRLKQRHSKKEAV